jgi:hypothetical protein
MAKKTLALTERPCKIGPSINTRTEHHGEEDVPAGDIPLGDIVLNQAELDALAPGAHARLFAKAEGGAIEPAMPELELTIRYAEKFENSQVTLEVEGNVGTLPQVTLAGISFVRQVGGTVHMALKVQTRLAEVDVRKLLNKPARVQLNFGEVPDKDRKQQNLALNEGEKREAA